MRFFTIFLFYLILSCALTPVSMAQDAANNGGDQDGDFVNAGDDFDDEADPGEADAAADGGGGEAEEAPSDSDVIPVTESFWRWGFYEVTVQRFSGEHPFYRLTKNKFFRDGRTAPNSTDANTMLINNKVDPINGPVNHDTDERLWVKIAHGIPPMSLEYIVPTGSSLLSAYGFEAYYTNTWLTDNFAAVGKQRQRDTPIVHLRSHYYMLSMGFRFFFPPGQNGVELIYGFGVAQIESTLRNGFRRAGIPEQYQSTVPKIFSKVNRYNSPGLVTFQKIGITSSVESFGVGLTLYLFDNTPVIGNPYYQNRFMTTTPTEKNVGLPGLIMRVSMVYNFWN